MLARLNCHSHNCPLWNKNRLWTLGQTNAVCLSAVSACHVSTWTVISVSWDLKIKMDLQQQSRMFESQPPSEEKLFWGNPSPWPNLPLLLLYSCIWQTSTHCFWGKPAKAVALLSPLLPFHSPLHTVSFTGLGNSLGKISHTQTP